MSNTVKNRPASINTTHSNSTQKPVAQKPASQPLSLKNESQQRRDKDAFDAMVARMPTPQADPLALSSKGEKSLAECQKLLSGFVTDGNANDALSSLKSLDAREFKLVTGKLERSGDLSTLLDNLPAEGRSGYLSTAAKAGVISLQPGKTATGPFNPPSSPARYVMQPEFPKCVNDAIHAESKSQTTKYKAAFESYVARYEAGVGATSTREQLAALGHPAKPDTTRDAIAPGVADTASYRADWNIDFPSSDSAYRAVSRQVSKLTGEVPDGKMWLDASVEGRLEGDVAGAEFGAKGVKAYSGVGVGFKGAVGVTVMSNGKHRLAVGPFEIEAKIENGQLKDGSLKAKGFGLAGKVGANDTGKIAMEGTLVVGDDSGGELLSVGAYSSVSSREATLTGGAVGAIDLGDFGAKGKVGVGYKGLTSKSARDVVKGKSVFDK